MLGLLLNLASAFALVMQSGANCFAKVFKDSSVYKLLTALTNASGST